MVPTELVDRARELIAAGLSLRTVAKTLRISEGTVRAIKHGRRPCYDRVDTRPTILDFEARNPKRCPTCGHVVELPCRLCQAREALSLCGGLSPTGEIVGPLGVDLRPEHQKRYEEVREARDATNQTLGLWEEPVTPIDPSTPQRRPECRSKQ